MLVETLRADWSARGANARVYALPEFADGALTFGAGTKIAGASGADMAVQEERAIALAAVATGRPLGPSAATHVRRALAKARDGDGPLALTHLALAGLWRLDDPRDDARRLFMADGLMKAGTPPSAILAALNCEAQQVDLERAYDPDQPRVPAGNGRPSGRWTSGDDAEEGGAKDATTSSSPAAGAANDGARGIQIADASDNWPQFLNPIGSAEAAQAAGAPFNGVGPNSQHQLGVNVAIAHYQALGYAVFSSGPTVVDIPGFLTPRVYDFVVKSPAGILIGVEVKTTMNDTVFLNPMQVAKDVLLMLNGGATVHGTGAPIGGVAYTTACRFCSSIDVRSPVLYWLLNFAKVPFRYDRLP